MKIPKEFYPLPDYPTGFYGWEYKGEAWVNLNETTYAWRLKNGEWNLGYSANVYGTTGQYFLKAFKLL